MEDFNISPQGQDPQKGSSKKGLIALAVLGTVAIISGAYFLVPSFGTQGYIKLDNARGVQRGAVQPINDYNNVDFTPNSNIQLDNFTTLNPTRGGVYRGGSSNTNTQKLDCNALYNKWTQSFDTVTNEKLKYEAAVAALSSQRKAEEAQALVNKSKEQAKFQANIDEANSKIAIANLELDSASKALSEAKSELSDAQKKLNNAQAAANNSYQEDPEQNQKNLAQAQSEYDAVSKKVEAANANYDSKFSALEVAKNAVGVAISALNSGQAEENYKKAMQAIKDKYSQLNKAELAKFNAAKDASNKLEADYKSCK